LVTCVVRQWIPGGLTRRNVAVKKSRLSQRVDEAGPAPSWPPTHRVSVTGRLTRALGRPNEDCVHRHEMRWRRLKRGEM
jgi:hypothetical protein